MIFTDDRGVPIPKPDRDDYATDYDYAVAFHAWKSRISQISSQAFDDAFRAAMKAKK